MRKNLFLAFAAFFLLTTIGYGQKFKDHLWEEVGLKFSVPSFVKIVEKNDEGLELESDDFLIYIDVVDEFDDLDELMDYFGIAEEITREKINEPTYKGETALGIHEDDYYNIFGNIQSKLNDREKIAFDISVYEWNEKTENYLNQIVGSFEFYDIDEGYSSSVSKGKTSNSSSKGSTSSSSKESAPKKSGWLSTLFKVGKTVLKATPLGGAVDLVEEGLKLLSGDDD